MEKTEPDSNIWIITDAIKKFYTKHKVLPLPGSVPDMKTNSDIYIRLQNIYKTKAREDAAEVKEYVKSHHRGREVDIQEIETYCKNAAFIKLIRNTQSKAENFEALIGT